MRRQAGGRAALGVTRRGRPGRLLRPGADERGRAANSQPSDGRTRSHARSPAASAAAHLGQGLGHRRGVGHRLLARLVGGGGPQLGGQARGHGAHRQVVAAGRDGGVDRRARVNGQLGLVVVGDLDLQAVAAQVAVESLLPCVPQGRGGRPGGVRAPPACLHGAGRHQAGPGGSPQHPHPRSLQAAHAGPRAGSPSGPNVMFCWMPRLEVETCGG